MPTDRHHESNLVHVTKEVEVLVVAGTEGGWALEQVRRVRTASHWDDDDDDDDDEDGT